MIKILIGCIITMVFPILLKSQINNKFDRTEADRVVKTYGYLIGQTLSLNKMKKEFPNLNDKIRIAEIKFESAFGVASNKITEYLKSFLGEKGFDEVQNQVSSEIQSQLKNQIFTESSAMKFISEIESRASGKIISPFIETLLTFQFEDNPEIEFLDGFTEIFKVTGHKKAKNTDWLIRLPKSWKFEESDFPNIIQKFRSRFGSGAVSINLIVKNSNKTLSKKEITTLLSLTEMKSSIPKNGKFISYKPIVIHNCKGALLEFEIEKEQLDFKGRIRMIQLVFVNANKFYFIQNLVTDFDNNVNLE